MKPEWNSDESWIMYNDYLDRTIVHNRNHPDPIKPHQALAVGLPELYERGYEEWYDELMDYECSDTSKTDDDVL